LLERARALGFDALATGHHARVIERDGVHRLRRGADRAKDQSYVLHVLGQSQLASIRLPVGEMTKAEVRRRALSLGLRTATKPESQDTCFVLASSGRQAFLADRIPLHAGRVVDRSGAEVGAVDAVELVTIGQRRGLGVAGGAPRYAIDVDTERAVVTVGQGDDLLTERVRVAGLTWANAPVAGGVLVQCRAHEEAVAARVDGDVVLFEAPHWRVAPGQSVVLYVGDEVVGGGIAVRDDLNIRVGVGVGV
jgi:tRNA-specific 2-thiouridylase